ncbi:mucin-2-like [Penaeus chinensis]|uniref:mucin-2-like n=1 Tax=Penaeus chinensis TaxID=139456 RepID=UPI001FB7ACF3|nr:mucin-2-like [Penaeus chinensis]
MLNPVQKAIVLLGVCVAGALCVDKCSPDCTGKPAGSKVPDPRNCTQYYLCLNGEVPTDHPLWCEPGEIFDTTLNECQVGTDCTDQCPATVPNCHFTCNGTYDLVSDPSSCSQYFVCLPHGLEGPFGCPAGAPYFNGENCVDDKDTCCSDPCTPFCEAAVTQVPDPTDCTKYYICLEPGLASEEYHFTCDAGQNFNYVTGRCDSGASCVILCGGSTVSPTGSSTLTPNPSTPISTEPSTPSTLTSNPSNPSTFSSDPSTPSTLTPNPSTLTPNPSNPSTLTPNPSNPSTLTPNPSNPSTLTPNPSNPSTLTPNPSNPSTLTPNPSTLTPNPSNPSTLTPTLSTFSSNPSIPSTLTPGPSTTPTLTPSPSVTSTTMETSTAGCVDSLTCTVIGAVAKCNICENEFFYCDTVGQEAGVYSCTGDLVFNPDPAYPFCVLPTNCPYHPPYEE